MDFCHEDSAESNVNTNSSKDHDFNGRCNFNICCDFNIYDTLSKTVIPTCPQQIENVSDHYVSENVIVHVTNVSEVENVHVVIENDTNSSPIVCNNHPNQNDFTIFTPIMSIYHIDPYIAEEQSTDNYAPNDLMQTYVNIVM